MSDAEESSRAGKGKVDKGKGKITVDFFDPEKFETIQIAATEGRVTEIPGDKKRELGKGYSTISDVLSYKILNKFKDLDGFELLNNYTNEWKDSQLYDREWVDITAFQKLPKAKEKTDFLAQALGGLVGYVSAEIVGKILAGAWGIYSCHDSTRFVFEEVPTMVKAGKDISDMEGRIINPTAGANKISFKYPDYATSDQDKKDFTRKWLRSGTYICASVLRLAVKDEDNYIRAWDYICAQYRNFYQEEICIKPNLNRDSIRAVRNLLQTRKILRDSLALFLLSHNGLLGQDKRMCTMLYELQLSYTGMHALSLLIFCASKMNVPISRLLGLLRHPATQDALETTAYILANYEHPGTPEKKAAAQKARTWKYARVFDPNVFGSLQTKKCPMLASILACVAQKLGTGEMGDPTKIKQLAGYITRQRDYVEGVADRIIRFCVDAGFTDKKYVR